MSANNDIRVLLYANGLRQWQLAKALGLHESALSRKMRTELPDAEKDRMRQVIKTLVTEH